MQNDRFFRHPLLPFAELRHSQGSAASFKAHMHHGFSIGAVERGRLVYEVDGHRAPLAPGALVLVNPETLHACNPDRGGHRSYYMLSLDTAWCLQVQQSLWAVEGFVAVARTRIDDPQLYDQYRRTMQCLMDDKIHLQTKEQRLFDLAVAVFLDACGPRVVVAPPVVPIDALKQLLRNDLHRDLPLGRLAAEISLNPYALIRSFKAATGLTPHRYRMNCRIEHARALLRAGHSLADTALECGFFDQSHFHRHFKAMTTVTPRAYRRNFIQ